ncbi:unnamed protein product [Fusarium graminearum]|nr:unnamed protein product [Fusarium graminearum]
MNFRRDFQFDPLSEEAAQLGNQDDLSNIDWSNPMEFMKSMGGPMPEFASPAKVRKEAREYSSNIFTSYELLNQILQRHEATIHKRWTGKTRQQRLQILLKAWPAMSASHRPDFEAFRRESNQQRESGSKFKDQFMWPCINQEDLLQPRMMLLLLNARGRNPPPVFAAVDNNAMHLGLVTKALVPAFLNEHTMILHGAATANDYGKLLDWDSHPDAFDWMNTRKQFLPGEGILVLESQARLMSFLVDFCHEILHEVPTTTITSDTYPIQPEPSFKNDGDTSGYTSLAVMAAEAPYRLPLSLDLDRVASLLEAQMLAAEDHIWSLREDPAYFSDQFREIQDHRQEMLPDTEGKPHPVTHRLREHTLWSRVIFAMLMDAYSTLDAITELHRQARHLSVLQKKYTKQIKPTEDLPQDYLVALLRFRFFLQQTAKGPLDQLKIAVPASPPMRKFFVRDTPIDKNSTKILVMSRRGVKMDKVETQLIWLLQTLWEDDRNLFLAQLPMVVDELQRLLQAEPKADVLISTHVAKIIGDLAIVAQCLKQLELYQPWAQQFEMIAFEYEDDFKKQLTTLQKPVKELHGAFMKKSLDDVAKLAEPSGGKFTYPYSKRRTKETVDTLRQAESRLDAIWAKIDDLTKATVANFKDTSLYRLLSQPRTLRRTAEWVEPEQGKDKKTPSLDKDLWSLDRPLSNLFFNDSEQATRKFDRGVQPKAKTKTKGDPRIEDKISTMTLEPEVTEPQQRFPVDSRALKVFRTIFFNPEVTSTPGSVVWNDFLYAMASVGFQIEKLYGSVWQFTPTKLDVERDFKFDEDLPDLGDEDWDDEFDGCECDESVECSCEDLGLTSEEKQRREPYTGSDAEYFYELKAYRSQRKHEVEEERQRLQRKKDKALKLDHDKQKEVQEAYKKLQHSKTEGNIPPIELHIVTTTDFNLYSSEFTQIWWDPYHSTRYIELYEMSKIKHTLGVPMGPGGIEPVQPQKKEKNEESLDEEGRMQGHIYFNSDTGCDLVNFEAPKYIGLNDYLIVTVPRSVALDPAVELGPTVKIPETFVFLGVRRETLRNWASAMNKRKRSPSL